MAENRLPEQNPTPTSLPHSLLIAHLGAAMLRGTQWEQCTSDCSSRALRARRGGIELASSNRPSELLAMSTNPAILWKSHLTGVVFAAHPKIFPGVLIGAPMLRLTSAIRSGGTLSRRRAVRAGPAPSCEIYMKSGTGAQHRIPVGDVVWQPGDLVSLVWPIPKPRHRAA